MIEPFIHLSSYFFSIKPPLEGIQRKAEPKCSSLTVGKKYLLSGIFITSLHQGKTASLSSCHIFYCTGQCYLLYLVPASSWEINEITMIKEILNNIKVSELNIHFQLLQ